MKTHQMYIFRSSVINFQCLYFRWNHWSAFRLYYASNWLQIFVHSSGFSVTSRFVPCSKYPKTTLFSTDAIVAHCCHVRRPKIGSSIHLTLGKSIFIFGVYEKCGIFMVYFDRSYQFVCYPQNHKRFFSVEDATNTFKNTHLGTGTTLHSIRYWNRWCQRLVFSKLTGLQCCAINTEYLQKFCKRSPKILGETWLIWYTGN